MMDLPGFKPTRSIANDAGDYTTMDMFLFDDPVHFTPARLEARFGNPWLVLGVRVGWAFEFMQGESDWGLLFLAVQSRIEIRVWTREWSRSGRMRHQEDRAAYRAALEVLVSACRDEEPGVGQGVLGPEAAESVERC